MTTTAPVRRGIPTTLSLDPDANILLRTMVPNRKAFGLFCSELIRREAYRRAERPHLLQMLAEEGNVMEQEHGD